MAESVTDVVRPAVGEATRARFRQGCELRRGRLAHDPAEVFGGAGRRCGRAGRTGHRHRPGVAAGPAG